MSVWSIGNYYRRKRWPRGGNVVCRSGGDRNWWGKAAVYQASTPCSVIVRGRSQDRKRKGGRGKRDHDFVVRAAEGGVAVDLAMGAAGRD